MTAPARPLELAAIEAALLDLARRQRAAGHSARAEGTLGALTKLRTLARAPAPPKPVA